MILFAPMILHNIVRIWRDAHLLREEAVAWPTMTLDGTAARPLRYSRGMYRLPANADRRSQWSRSLSDFRNSYLAPIIPETMAI